MSAFRHCSPTLTLPRADALPILTLEGEEAISRPFRFDVTLEIPGALQDPGAWLGQGATLSFPLGPDRPPRVVHGIVAQASLRGVSPGGTPRYGCRLIPWFKALAHHIESQVFNHGDGVDGVLSRLFESHGYRQGVDFECRNLEGGGEAWPLRVQYKESAFAFASRLMESAGIWYCFEHQEGSCRMVLGDNNRAFPRSPLAPEVVVGQAPPPGHPGHLNHLNVERSLTPGGVSLGDYHFGDPSNPFDVSCQSGGDLLHILHPGGFQGLREGETLVRRRVEGHLGAGQRLRGQGNHPGMSPGTLFDVLGGHPGVPSGQTLLVVACRHHFVGGVGLGGPHYEQEVEVLPGEVAFRPPRVTPAPRAMGTETATVVGPPGESLWVDEHGRVRIQFHWDRKGRWDGNSTCWVRVAQGLAGPGAGSLLLPRVGDEVLVGFLHGRPERPVVIGSLYNGETRAPYPLPEEQGRHVFRTQALRGSGGAELSIDDGNQGAVSLGTSGAMSIAVEGDMTEEVGGALTLKVGAETKADIQGALTVETGGGGCTIESQGGDIVLKTGLSALTLKADGTIELKGVNVSIQGAGTIESKAMGHHRIRGAMVFIN